MRGMHTRRTLKHLSMRHGVEGGLLVNTEKDAYDFDWKTRAFEASIGGLW